MNAYRWFVVVYDLGTPLSVVAGNEYHADARDEVRYNLPSLPVEQVYVVLPEHAVSSELLTAFEQRNALKEEPC